MEVRILKGLGDGGEEIGLRLRQGRTGERVNRLANTKEDSRKYPDCQLLFGYPSKGIATP